LKAASAIPPPDSEADKTTFTETQEFETTYTTNATTRNASTSIPKASSTGIPKKKVKPKLTAKEKKDRSVSTANKYLSVLFLIVNVVAAFT
jgi:DASH complex subunit DAM1